MVLTIELKPELEAQLHEAAARTGSDTNTFVVQSLQERLQRQGRRSLPSHLSAEESALLAKINKGLPEATWQEYHDLVAKRRAETLTPEEHARLLALSDSISEAHTERMIDAAALARLRGISLELLLKQLKIKPRKV